MAFIGLRYAVVAEKLAHTPGSEPTYGAGRFLGKLRRVDLNIERGNNPLRADDEDAEIDNSITAMNYTIETDDLIEDEKVYIGLLDEITQGTSTYYTDHDGPTKEMGFGYMRVRQKNNRVVYQCIWVYDIMLAQDSENATTMPQGNREWQTPTCSGSAKPLKVDSTNKRRFRKIANFQDEAPGLQWLKGLAGIVDETAGG